MSTNRVQHRSQRDASNRENADLKKDNAELRRQVARLRREVDRLSSEEVEESPDAVPETTRANCPKCGSEDIGEFPIPGGKKALGCRACRKWREVR